jgi:lysophospholipase L1-like esterase
MRTRFVNPAVFLIFCVSVLAPAAAAQTYYVALGDSLSVGYQPINGGLPPYQGYADDLKLQLSQTVPGLTLVKLGCIGETSTTMVQGGHCDNYPLGSSQLDAAVSFLQTHQVALVTIDIGANDVDGCVSPTAIDTSCIQKGFQSVGANLPWILSQLRRAAGPHTAIVGMNYYDPFLAAWALGKAGQALALETLASATDFNVLLGAIYQAFHVPVADVAHAFRTYNFLPVPGENLPVNVFLILAWTYMGAPSPIGPNIHPNAAGYAAIAGAFASKISQ